MYYFLLSWEWDSERSWWQNLCHWTHCNCSCNITVKYVFSSFFTSLQELHDLFPSLQESHYIHFFSVLVRFSQNPQGPFIPVPIQLSTADSSCDNGGRCCTQPHNKCTFTLKLNYSMYTLPYWWCGNVFIGIFCTLELWRICLIVSILWSIVLDKCIWREWSKEGKGGCW